MTKTQSVAESLTALESGDIEHAVSLSCEHSGKEGALYEQDTVSIVRTILEHDYTPDERLKERVLAPLRVVAAAMELWGSEEASQYAEITGNWDYRYNPAIALKLLHIAGVEKHRLKGLEAMGVEQVKITFPEATPLCAACAALQGQVFAIAEAPMLPLAACTGEVPCNGHYLAANTASPLLA